MEKNKMLLPLLASLGVGAATYYTVSKNNHNLEKTIKNVLPLVSQQMSGESGRQTEQIGPHEMS